MNKRIENRVIRESQYMINTNKTIREIAKDFKVSKSTVHKDLKDRLKKVDLDKYKIIKQIIKNHIATRHIKGGEATKKKYEKLNKNV